MSSGGRRVRRPVLRTFRVRDGGGRLGRLDEARIVS